MFWFEPPTRLRTTVHLSLPEKFRNVARSDWAEPNRLGQEVDSFLEGPSFDREGNLWFVDIPFGRIFRLDPKGNCELVCQYDGWPNGLKITKEGRFYICCYKKGLLELDPVRGTLTTVLGSRNSESFKGLNDLIFAANGDCYFTDQGQTGIHDWTGRVFRYVPSTAKLDLLLSNVPSPNGIVLNGKENRLFVAVTRQNAVWRAPIMLDGSVSKVGTYLQLSGGHGGPDGMAIDAEDGLYVAHLGMGIWRFNSDGIPTHLIEAATGHHMTNLAFGGPENRTLYITEADTGTIQTVEVPVPGKVMHSHH